MIDSTPNTTGKLAAALAQVQSQMPKVKKGNTARIPGKQGQTGYSYTYADLGDVSDAILPLLTAQGLAFSCTPRNTGNGYEIAGVLLHESGERLEGALPLHGNQPQQIGSAITYARRYLLGCLTGIVTDDDVDAAPAQEAPRTRSYSGPTTEQLLNQVDADATRIGKTYAEVTAKFREKRGGISIEELDQLEPWVLKDWADAVHAAAEQAVAAQQQPDDPKDGGNAPAPDGAQS